MLVGVVALQGAFIEHIEKLQALNIETRELRQRKDIDATLDAILLPGGESTVIAKLLNDLDMLEPLKAMMQNGVPVFGTCAGLILLSKTIVNGKQKAFQLMDITTVRNGYGRQTGSFLTTASFQGKLIPMVFIRAPYIKDCEEQVEVLAIVNNYIVAARQKNMLVCAFHPELTEDNSVYTYFIQMIKDYKKR